MLAQDYTLMPGAEPFLFEAGEVGCLLVHGFTSTPFEMRGLGEHLAQQGITAGSVLLAGHGTAPEDLGRVAWHDWYASVSMALDGMLARCDKVYLAGLSLGGALTLYTAAQRGQDLAGIVVMSSPLYIPRGVGTVLRRMERRVPYLRKPFRDIQDPVARARHVGYMRSPVSSVATLVDFLAHVRRSLKQVTVPALVIYSRHDHVVPPISSRLIYRRLGSPDKRLLALDNGFHIVTVDKSKEKVYREVGEFILMRET